MGLRNVYKDMLNNMVSPIYHVVINHQNQTYQSYEKTDDEL
jgi:hypothetical protein